MERFWEIKTRMIMTDHFIIPIRMAIIFEKKKKENKC